MSASQTPSAISASLDDLFLSYFSLFSSLRSLTHQLSSHTNEGFFQMSLSRHHSPSLILDQTQYEGRKMKTKIKIKMQGNQKEKQTHKNQERGKEEAKEERERETVGKKESDDSKAAVAAGSNSSASSPSSSSSSSSPSLASISSPVFQLHHLPISSSLSSSLDASSSSSSSSCSSSSSSSSSESSHSHISSSGIRQRVFESHKSLHERKLDALIATQTLSEGEREDVLQRLDAESKDTDVPEVDLSQQPLSWFGLLVPPQLNKASKEFELGLEKIVEIANVKIKMREIEIKYEKLKQEKERVEKEEAEKIAKQINEIEVTDK